MSNSMRPTVRAVSTVHDRPDWPLPPVRHGTPERVFWRACFGAALALVIGVQVLCAVVR